MNDLPRRTTGTKSHRTIVLRCWSRLEHKPRTGFPEQSTLRLSSCLCNGNQTVLDERYLTAARSSRSRGGKISERFATGDRRVTQHRSGALAEGKSDR